MRILLVEDDSALGSAVEEHVVETAHAVDWMQNLADARECASTVAYDLILLDLMLPDGRGIDFLKEIRASGNTVPVIILTAKDQISDRIDGLNAGADDYLVKPFDLAELSARIAAVGRRYAGNPNPKTVIGDLEIDRADRSILKGGKSVDLTAKEWELMEALIQRPGAILSKAKLEDRLYGFGDEVESNTIEVHISRLRKKLGSDLIETVRGVGYRLGKR